MPKTSQSWKSFWLWKTLFTCQSSLEYKNSLTNPPSPNNLDILFASALYANSKNPNNAIIQNQAECITLDFEFQIKCLQEIQLLLAKIAGGVIPSLDELSKPFTNDARSSETAQMLSLYQHFLATHGNKEGITRAAQLTVKLELNNQLNFLNHLYTVHSRYPEPNDLSLASLNNAIRQMEESVEEHTSILTHLLEKDNSHGQEITLKPNYPKYFQSIIDGFENLRHHCLVFAIKTTLFITGKLNQYLNV